MQIEPTKKNSVIAKAVDRAFGGLSIKQKLIGIFVATKVAPMLLVGALMYNGMQHIGSTAVEDSKAALDVRSQEAIENVTTTTARQIADFLYDRDRDIKIAAMSAMSEDGFKQFLSAHSRTIYGPGDYKISGDGKAWVPVNDKRNEVKVTRDVLKDNATAWHARAVEYMGQADDAPLFVEMTFVDLNGQEKIKATTGGVTDKALKNVADRGQTYVKAETYFPELKKLKPGEIYVSDVIGAYVPTKAIGAYTPETRKKAEKPFEPEKSAYAGLENPVGKHYQGIVRWATPVIEGGKITGYVTLALDHNHIRQFTDHLMPTDARYTDIADAGKGNYGFIWDYKGRNISHPRDYFITGYDQQTGNPATPWMDEEMYASWQKSGNSAHEFLATVPEYDHQSATKKPAKDLVKAGTVGLDCRYLNFSPQCDGWKAVTEHGGSGSFQIYFQNLWKLTTAAAIPYYTGQYGRTPQGFGIVTVGANVDDFHAAANTTAEKIKELIASTTRDLSISTSAMVMLVIAIAIWMANALVKRITGMVSGIRKFEDGDLAYRLPESRDEMGQLASGFNKMASQIEANVEKLEADKAKAVEEARKKTERMQMLSHELNTPMNSVISFSEIGKDMAEDEMSKDCFTRVYQSGRNMLRTVGSLGDIARYDDGKMAVNLAEHQMGNILGTLDLYRELAAEKGLEFTTVVADDVPQSVSVDRGYVEKVLEHFADNAVKFTEAGSINLSVSVAGDKLRISMRDTGCGVGAEWQEMIWNEGQQAGSFLTRTHQGAGMGLAVARAMAIVMNGTYGVNSTEGDGAEFWIELPLNPDAA